MEQPTVDRVTRQRNIQLQKQLGVKLQIINEEYRMVKQDQDKNSRELSDFISCLRHTAPGLSSYGQPDTRTMTVRHYAPNRKSVHWETDGSVDKMYLKTARKTPCLNGINRFGDASPRSPPDGDVTAYVTSPRTNPRPRSEPAARNSFFNKRIALDSRRHSFIANTMKTVTGFTAAGNTGSSNTTVTSLKDKHNVAPSCNGEVTTKLPVHSYCRSSLPKYGRDAYSAQEQKDRNNLLLRFEDIFETCSSHWRNKVGSVISLEAILSVPNDESKFVENDSKSKTCDVNIFSKKSPAPNSLCHSRRVVWSAPVKHNIDNDAISVVTSANAVTTRVQHNKLSHPPGGDSAVSSHTEKTGHTPSSMIPSKWLHGDQNSDFRSFSGFLYTNRPKTAPPSYELKQRGVAAPRQQVAGILAEIQSRRADTRAILSKSRQLHQVVRTLTPQLPQDDDSD